MRVSRILALVIVAGCITGTSAYAKSAREQPAQPSDSAQPRQILCTAQTCRPVKKGCHLERIGLFNEEVCK